MLVRGMVMDKREPWLGKRDQLPATQLTVWDETAKACQVQIKGKALSDFNRYVMGVWVEAVIGRVFANTYPGSSGATVALLADGLPVVIPAPVSVPA